MNTLDELVTAKEVRKKFGWSEATLYRRINERKITFHRYHIRPQFKQTKEMKITIPYKDKPWLELHEPGYWSSLMGCGSRLVVNTSHPEWIEKVLKPTIEKFKKSNMWDITKC